MKILFTPDASCILTEALVSNAIMKARKRALPIKDSHAVFAACFLGGLAAEVAFFLLQYAKVIAV